MRIGISSLLICLVFAGCAPQARQETLPSVHATSRTATGLFAFAEQSAASAQPSAALPLTLPLKPKSVRFAVIGDNGTGDEPEFDVAREMEAYRKVVNFTFVIMLGDNIYGRHNPTDFARKFEEPYKPLLDAGVKFYASLGNHDHPEERQYKPFNMGRRALLQLQEKRRGVLCARQLLYESGAAQLAGAATARIPTQTGRSATFTIRFTPMESFTDPISICARC